MGLDLYKQILNKYKKIIGNLNHENNKKIIICFSGIPGSGKTYIAKILEERYKAIRINNDNIRKIIRKSTKNYDKLGEEERQGLLHDYLFYCP